MRKEDSPAGALYARAVRLLAQRMRSVDELRRRLLSATRTSGPANPADVKKCWNFCKSSACSTTAGSPTNWPAPG